MAGGFGFGIPSEQLPTEVAPVVPYRGLETRELQKSPITSADDPEAAYKRRTFKSSGSSSIAGRADEPGALVSSDTPFFHFDLVAAVKATEAGAASSARQKDHEDHYYSKS